MHVHTFTENPSYIVRTLDEVEKVWCCSFKGDGYCMETKEEITKRADDEK